MYSENEIELTAEERTMLSALPREIPPSDMLEERVMRALRREGHLGSPQVRRSRSFTTILKIAAAVALFAGGVATGRYVLLPDVPRSASLSQPERMRTNDTVQPSRESVPVNGETIVAEREIWM